jgi:integrase
MPTKVKYTKLRGVTYHLNIPIPPAIQAKYDGKVAFERSTGTTDANEAEKQVRVQKAIFDTEVREAARRADQARLRKLLDPADAAAVDSLGGVAGLVEAVEGLRKQAAFLMAGEGVTSSAMEVDEVRWDAKNAAGKWSAAFVPFKVDTGGEDLPPDAMREIQTRAEVAAHRAFSDTVTAEIRRLKGVAAALKAPLPPAPAFLDEGASGIRDIADHMADAKGYTKQLRDSLTYTVRRWVELHGDMPPAKWEKSHISAFADALKGLPITREKRVQDLPIGKAIEVAKAENLEVMGDKIRQTRVDHMKSLAVYAFDQMGVIKADPFGRFAVIKTKVKHSARHEESRKPFTPDQVRRVLAHAATFHADTLDRWAPMLAFYTGARREEIGQLSIGDVADWGNMLTLTITDEGEDQKVKNRHSFRTIPVPPILMDAGFGDFVVRRRQAGGRMLFLRPYTNNRTKVKTLREVGLTKRGRFTEGYGTDFSRDFLPSLGLSGAGLSFHSTRHSWTDAARRADINKEIRRLIAGRLDGEDATESGYGGADLLQDKLAAMVQVTPFLTLD